MNQKLRPNRTGEEGQAVIMITLGLTFLLGLLGLVVDVGYGYYVKQAAQGAADAAVMAAITVASGTRGTCSTSVSCQSGFSCSSNPTNADNFGVACLYAKANGFVNGASQTVSISSGSGVAPSAPGINTKYWVSVTASQKMSLGFLSALGVQSGWISAQSTAGINVGPSAGCIYVLDSNKSQALKVSGTSVFESNCGIYVNSNSSNAISISNNATVTASFVNVVGSVPSGTNLTPAAATGTAAITDPLASLQAPTFSGCDYTGMSISGGSTTLNPGVYCGGISITGQANVTFNPGTYILNGGGLSATSNNTTLTGNGVSFYNTETAGYHYSPISITGGTSLTLSAPTSGTYQGVLIFQDRSITTGGSNSITGGTNTSLSGTIYLPGGSLAFTGGTTSYLTLALVVDQLTVTGNARLQKDTTGATTAVQVTASLLQ